MCKPCGRKAKQYGGSRGGLAGSVKAKRVAGRSGPGNRTCGKHKRAAGSLGGAANGTCKARYGTKNGNCSLDLQRYQTWRPIQVPFEVFLDLLRLLHQRRLAKHARPWLRLSDVPSTCGIPGDEAARVITIMTETKFGHPDRYQDIVNLD